MIVRVCLFSAGGHTVGPTKNEIWHLPLGYILFKYRLMGPNKFISEGTPENWVTVQVRSGHKHLPGVQHQVQVQGELP